MPGSGNIANTADWQNSVNGLAEVLLIRLQGTTIEQADGHHFREVANDIVKVLEMRRQTSTSSLCRS